MSDAQQYQTTENLREAFTRDAAVEARYTYFARLAEFEGLTEVAAMFRGIAETGRVLIDGHLDFLVNVADPLSRQPLGETEANLLASIAEQGDSIDLCAQFAHTARAEGLHAAASWFESLVRNKAAHLRWMERSVRDLTGATST